MGKDWQEKAEVLKTRRPYQREPKEPGELWREHCEQAPA